MAHEKEHDRANETKKTGLAPQTPLPLAERRRLYQQASKPAAPGQIYTDWALI